MESEVKKCKVSGCDNCVPENRKIFCSKKCYKKYHRLKNEKNGWYLRWRIKNRERIRAYAKENRKKHRHKILIKHAEYRKKNRELINQRNRINSRKRRLKNPEHFAMLVNKYKESGAIRRTQLKRRTKTNELKNIRRHFGTSNVDISVKKMESMIRLSIMIFYGIIDEKKYSELKKEIDLGNTHVAYGYNLTRYINAINNSARIGVRHGKYF